MNNIVRLSQCMIVKNEEKNIVRALSWGKDIVFEQIVVDTGSTDRTVEIAERMGAKVYHFPWIDDFSEAKNFAIEKASGNWIAFLDADEYLTEKDAVKIKSILVNLEEDKSTLKPHVINSTKIDIEEDGKAIGSTTQYRFFRNIPSLRYKNRIHEILTLAGGQMIVGDLTKEVPIFHTGYTHKAYDETQKLERNISMLRKELDDNPENYIAAMYLAESLKASGNLVEAEHLYRDILENGKDFLGSSRLTNSFYGLMYIIVLRSQITEEDELVQLYRDAVQTDKDYPDFDYLLGVWYFQMECYQKATYYMETCLKKFEKYDGIYTTYIPAKLKDVYGVLIRCYVENSKKQDVVRCCVFSLGLDRYQGIVLNTLLDLLKQDGLVVESVIDFLKKLYNFNLIKDILFIIEIAKKNGYKVLEEALVDEMSDEDKDWYLNGK